MSEVECVGGGGKHFAQESLGRESGRLPKEHLGYERRGTFPIRRSLLLMLLRRLTPADASDYQALRLAALRAEPFAFSSSYEEERDYSASVIKGRLAARMDRGVFGAFENDELVGLVALGRLDGVKLSHKALIWSMYVRPEFRRKGLARALLGAALSLAGQVPGVQQVNLSVNAGNLGALRLYESVGFKAYGREPGALLINGELHDEIHLSLRLTPG